MSQGEDKQTARRISRRTFLQAAGAAGAELALGPVARAQSGGTPDGGPFVLRWDGGALVSLKRAQDKFDTDYVLPGRRLGDVFLRCRRAGTDWQTLETAKMTAAPAPGGPAGVADYPVPAAPAGPLHLQTRWAVEGTGLVWTLTVRNLAERTLEIDDLATPLPMNTVFKAGQPAAASVLKHGLISGHGSFLFWMRSNSAGPYLTLTPHGDTSLEYWDTQDDYRVYFHSVAAGADEAGHGGRWRQPHTGVTLAPAGQAGDSRTYGLRFDWADGYDGVRQTLVDNGQIDVHVVPGMTVPSDLSARFALRTRQDVQAVEAEWPSATRIVSLGRRGDAHLYEVRFSRLGENRLTIRYARGRQMFLEFFCTEPLETLIRKRGAFIARHQHRDPARWYNGLLAEWNMDSQTLLGPDNYDRIRSWRIYEVTCDDPGLSRPAYLAAKNAEYPVQSEVEALDYYVKHFVWGGLQRTTEETHSYGIYGILDWKSNRESSDPGTNGRLHLWRVYDYPHVIVMYYGLYRIAKNFPQIRTALPAAEYLRRAAGTALALFTVPKSLVNWDATQTGLYNERVIVDLIADLEAAGLPAEAGALRGHWEDKVKFFVNDSPDLFGSEYPFDSTGFESTHALAKYALSHAAGTGAAALDVTPAAARRFLETQMAANLFCRGWLEPAYYYLGSDFRASAGDAYTLSYMAQMGGWSVLDYALYDVPDPAPLLRLGYASILSSWALMNSGTPDSDYGYWYPGPANDGGAGGGFEPAPYGETWLDQPHHRGAWYYSCEINLGYCGALRSAATVLADDTLFGRICYGGDWTRTAEGLLAVTPKDGVRRRFHALLGGRRLHLLSDTARFAAGQPLMLREDLSEIRFQLESDNPAAHTARLRLSGLTPGRHSLHGGGRLVAAVQARAGQETLLDVPLPAAPGPHSFVIQSQKVGSS